MKSLLESTNRKSDLECISDDLTSLLQSISTTKTIDARTFLFQEGEEAHELYVIQHGLIQISKLTQEGNELNLRTCQEGDIVGELTLFTDEAKYMLNAYALKKCKILIIQKDQLEKELLSNSRLTFEFMKWMTNLLRINQSKIKDLVMNGKKGALYSTLIRFSNSYGIQQKDGRLIDMHLTNQEIAKFCAATRESINRMLNDLKKKGIIQITKESKILIKDIHYLRTEIGCDHCPIDICVID